MQAIRSSRVSMLEIFLWTWLLITFQIFSMILISGDWLAKKYWRYPVHFSTDELAKNGALEHCRLERTLAYHQNVCILPAMNAHLRCQCISESQYCHQLVLMYQRQSKKCSPRTWQIFFDFGRHQDMMAATLRLAFAKHTVFCFCQLQPGFRQKILLAASDLWHSMLASVCTKKPDEPDSPCELLLSCEFSVL